MSEQSRSDVEAIATALYVRLGTRCGPQPKPIRVPVLDAHLVARTLSGNEATAYTPPTFREIPPAHFQHPFAVYELHPGEFHVMPNGNVEGQPFVTSDPELASVVCDRWAKEFGEDR